jgi:hypothetical protein
MAVAAEKAIQSAVINYVHTSYPHLIITATANERSYKEKKQIGSLGITDLILFHPSGAVLFLELKTTKGKLSPSQKEWNAAYDAAGFPHTRAVAYGFSEAQKIISDWVLTQ